MDTLYAFTALTILFGCMFIPNRFASYYLKSQRYRMTYTHDDRWPDPNSGMDPHLREERRRAAEAEEGAVYQSGLNIGYILMFGSMAALGWLAHQLLR